MRTEFTRKEIKHIVEYLNDMQQLTEDGLKHIEGQEDRASLEVEIDETNELIRKLKGYTPPREPIMVDIGCGTDPDRWIPGTYKLDLYNVDDGVFADSEDIHTLKALYNKYPTFDKDRGIIAFDMLTDSLPFDNNSVDVIFMRYSLTYMCATIEELCKVLTECMHVLKPQGQLIIQDYCHAYAEEEDRFVEMNYTWWELCLYRALKDPVLSARMELTFAACNEWSTGDEYQEFMWRLEKKPPHG